MIFEDTFEVAAPLDRVWAFLRDPQQVARCIPGCEQVDVVDDRTYHVRAGAKVSFLSVLFAMKVALTEIDEPRRLVSRAEGMDERLKERIRLVSELTLEPRGPDRTGVGYKIDLAVFGKLASLGLSVMKGKARQMAEQFARDVRARLEAQQEGGRP